MVAIALGVYSCTPVEDNMTSVSEEVSKSLGTAVYKGKEYPNAFAYESLGEFTDATLQQAFETHPEMVLYLDTDAKLYMFDDEADLRTHSEYKHMFRETLENATKSPETTAGPREVGFEFVNRSGQSAFERVSNSPTTRNLPGSHRGNVTRVREGVILEPRGGFESMNIVFSVFTGTGGGGQRFTLANDCIERGDALNSQTNINPDAIPIRSWNVTFRKSNNRCPR